MSLGDQASRGSNQRKAAATLANFSKIVRRSCPKNLKSTTSSRYPTLHNRLLVVEQLLDNYRAITRYLAFSIEPVSGKRHPAIREGKPNASHLMSRWRSQISFFLISPASDLDRFIGPRTLLANLRNHKRFKKPPSHWCPHNRQCFHRRTKSRGGLTRIHKASLGMRSRPQPVMQSQS